MAIVTERHTQAQAPPDPKKPSPHQVNNDRDLDVNIKDQGFFGSFFAGGKASAKERAKHATMESVRRTLGSAPRLRHADSRRSAAAAVAQGQRAADGPRGDGGRGDPHAHHVLLQVRAAVCSGSPALLTRRVPQHREAHHHRHDPKGDDAAPCCA
jgi:hypothetical protein